MELANARLNRLAEIFAGVAEVSLASIIIPYAIDKSNTVLLLLGVVAFVVFVILSLIFTRPKND